MKLVRLLSRLVLLSLAAAAFVGLTGIYGGSARPLLLSPRQQEARRHRPSAPEVFHFPELFAGGFEVAFFALAGRIVFRLRLSRVSRKEERLTFLNLQQRGGKTSDRRL